MTLEIPVQFGSSMRRWVTLKGSTNPFSVTGGPVPSVVIPLEARVAERDIEFDIVRHPRAGWPPNTSHARGLGEPDV